MWLSKSSRSEYFAFGMDNPTIHCNSHIWIHYYYYNNNNNNDNNNNRDLDREEQLKNGSLETEQGPSKDYSIKAGEKISIKLPVRFSCYNVNGDGGGLLT